MIEQSQERSFLIEIFVQEFGDGVINYHSFRGDDTVVLRPGLILDACRLAKEDPRLDLNFLMDLTAVDYLGREPRFEVVYHLYSLRHNHRLRLKIPVGEGEKVKSVTRLWKVANWLEREVWDMFGIVFEGHPDLRRILMYEEFVGHPLRKDYPHRKRQPRVRQIKEEM